MTTARSIAPSPEVPFHGGRQDSVRLLEGVPVLELLGACRKLGEFWGLGPDVMANLLATSRTTWFRWVEMADASRGEPLWTPDQRSRVFALLRIFEATGDLHQAEEDFRAWPREALGAPGFEGKTPLEVMQSGVEGLLLVRDYLNFVLGAWS